MSTVHHGGRRSGMSTGLMDHDRSGIRLLIDGGLYNPTAVPELKGNTPPDDGHQSRSGSRHLPCLSLNLSKDTKVGSAVRRQAWRYACNDSSRSE